MAGIWDAAPTEDEKKVAGVWESPPTPDEVAGARAAAPKQQGPPPSAAAAFVRGADQGATLGFGDELTGAVQAYDRAGLNAVTSPLAFAAHLTTGRPVKEFFENNPLPSGSFADKAKKLLADYKANRDSERQENQTAQAAHPGLLGAYGLGNFAGGVATSALLPGAAAGSGAVGAAKAGAAIGAASGIGSSNGGLGETAADAAIGGLGGAALGFGMTKGAEWLSPRLKSMANSQAVQALKGLLKDYRALEHRSDPQEFGAELLAKKIIPWYGGAENIAKRAGAEAQNQAGIIQDSIGALDRSAEKQSADRIRSLLPTGEPQPGPGLVPLKSLGFKNVDPEQLVGEINDLSTAAGSGAQGLPTRQAQPQNDLLVRPSTIREKATQEIVKPLRGPGGGNEADRLAEEIANFKTQSGVDKMNIQETNDALHRFDGRIGDAYDQKQGVFGSGLKQLRGIARGEQQAAAERIDPVLAKRMAEAKLSYGTMARATGIAEDKAIRNMTNRTVSPSDYLAMATTAAGGGGSIETVMSAIANHLLRERGSAAAANFLNFASSEVGDTLLRTAVVRGGGKALGKGIAAKTASLIGRSLPQDSQTGAQ